MVSGVGPCRLAVALLMLSVAFAACSRKDANSGGKARTTAGEQKKTAGKKKAVKTETPGESEPAGQGAEEDVTEAGEPDAVNPYEEEPEEPMPAIEEEPEQTLRDKLKNLKFKARRDVMWARAAIANSDSYRRSLEKFDRNAEEWELYSRVPREPELDLFEAQLKEMAGNIGVTMEFLQIEQHKVEARNIPEIIHGEKSFEFEDSDLRGMAQVVMRLNLEAGGKLVPFIQGLKRQERLFILRRVMRSPDGIVINGEVYYLLQERFPLHVVEPKDLEQAMKNFGIEISAREAVKLDPVGHLQNAALSYKEFNRSLPALNESMKLLSESSFKSARSEFFRRTSELADRSMREWERKVKEYGWDK